MGKIKTVIMGDIEVEEAARRSEKTRREQKQRAKSVKQEEESVKAEEAEKAEKMVEKLKRLTLDANRYRLPPGKKYAAARLLVDPKKLYSLSEAIELVKKTSFSKFDGSVEAHINVVDKGLRGTVSPPHGTGKTIRVAVADDSLIKSLEQGGKIDFDILVASPEMMGKLAKVAKILGPRGLMPNLKTNTISEHPEELVKILSSSVSWKTEADFPIIHIVIGKVSFEAKKLEENLMALTKSIGRDKIKSVFLKATMGPSVEVGIN